jgi:dephospho-CoA kinase
MILGITGKSGTGKHTAAQFFQQRHWKVIDADKVAHKLYRPYQRIWREVVDRFGEKILTTEDVIDRQKLRKIVFGKDTASKKALADLNAIVHPEVRRYLKDEAYYLKKKKAKAVIIAALWEELGLFEICEKVLLVKAGDALAFERVKKRDGIDFDMFEAYTANQKEPEKAHATVVNEGSFQDLYKKLNEVIAKFENSSL